LRDLFLFTALVLCWYWLRRPRLTNGQKWYYDTYLKSPHWIATAAKKRKQAGYKCERCHQHKQLDVHHKTYERRGHELMSDLEALCRECHDKEK